MKRYAVHRLTNPEPDWSAAEVLTDFVFPWETTVPPLTEFRALWGEESLHFRFDCADDDLVVADGLTAKDRVIGSDRVELFLAPDLSLNPYYCFEIDPRGDVLAYRARFHRLMDWEWSCDALQVLSAQMDRNRYRVEGTLRLETLRDLNVLKPGSHEFFAGVYRAEFSHKPDGLVHMGWMPWVNPNTENPDFHVPASFGVFELK